MMVQKNVSRGQWGREVKMMQREKNGSAAGGGKKIRVKAPSSIKSWRIREGSSRLLQTFGTSQRALSPAPSENKDRVAAAHWLKVRRFAAPAESGRF